MKRFRTGYVVGALAVGLAALSLSLTPSIGIAQGRSYDLSGEWAITKTGTYFTDPGFTNPDPLRLEKIDPNTFRIASAKWPETRLRFEDSELKYYSESGAVGATGKKLDLDPNTGKLRSIEWNDGAIWTPKEGRPPTTSNCPPNLASNWGMPISGKMTFQVSGNTVTGTIANLGGKFGLATVMGTASGKTMNGTWKSATGSGMITVSGPDASCMVWMTYSTSATTPPPPPVISEPTTERGQPTENLGPSSGHGGGNPWETPQGKDCIEKWIVEATRMLNTVDLGHDMNSLRPYSFNQYGHLLNRTVSQPNAPDAWELHGRNKYKYMWEYYNTDVTGGQWRGTGPDGFGSDAGALKKAGVPTLRDYVRNCAPGSAPGSTREPPLGDGMRLWTDHYTVQKGKTVNVKVLLTNAKDVRNIDFALDYDSSLVAMRGEPVRGAVVEEYTQSNLERPGLLKFNFARLAPFTYRGDAQVAGFTFEGLNVGTTPLKLSLSPGNKLPLQAIPGSIQVHEGLRPPGTQWPPPGIQPPGIGGPTCSGTGRQSPADVQCCLKMWVGIIPTNPIMNLNRDTDENGNPLVDSNDAIMLMDLLAARGELR